MDTCVRVYNNGEEVHLLMKDEKETQDWLEYNRTFRFGCALFVNGICKYCGYLSEERCKELESKFLRTTKPSGV